MRTPSKMPRRNIIFRIIYIGLAATSFLFVQKTMNEYLAGKTDYHKSYLPTTMKDFPTITLCFKHKGNLNYGKDFSIGLYQNYSDDKDLSDGKLIGNPFFRRCGKADTADFILIPCHFSKQIHSCTV